MTPWQNTCLVCMRLLQGQEGDKKEREMCVGEREGHTERMSVCVRGQGVCVGELGPILELIETEDIRIWETTSPWPITMALLWLSYLVPVREGFTLKPRQALSSWSSCLNPLSTGITNMYYHPCQAENFNWNS